MGENYIKGEHLKELHDQQHQTPRIVPGRRNEEQPSDLMLGTPLFTLTVIVCVLMYLSVYDSMNEREMRKQRQSAVKKESCAQSFNRN